jgi:hypothetical protein
MKYADQGAQSYDAQYRKQQVIHLKRKAAELGLQIIEVAAARPKTIGLLAGVSEEKTSVSDPNSRSCDPKFEISQSSTTP